MKILMITPYLSPVYGGITKIVQEVVEGLARQGCEVDLLTTDAKLPSDVDYIPNQWIKRDGYRVCYCASVYRFDLIFSASLLSWLWKNIDNYHLIHTNTIFSPLMTVVFFMCRLKRKPYIVTPHGMLEPWAFQHRSGKKKPYYNLLEKSNLNGAIALQGTASVETENIKSFNLKPQVFFVPNGLHPEDFINLPTPEIFYQRFPETRDKTLIIFLARLHPKKGLDLLAPAFAEVKKQYANTHLIIAGPDNEGFLPMLKNHFIEAGCMESVTFTGMLRGEIKYSALSAADIYVAPSYSEGFSMSVLEGMASNLPSVITKGCNFPEAEEAQAAKVVDIDVKSITSALLWCLSHPEEAQGMADRGRKFILDNYTWDQVARKLMSQYDRLLKQVS